MPYGMMGGPGQMGMNSGPGNNMRMPGPQRGNPGMQQIPPSGPMMRAQVSANIFDKLAKYFCTSSQYECVSVSNVYK